MKIAYFDCQFGAAGDMLNASLLGAGLDHNQWLSAVRKIALPSGKFTIKIEEAMRCGIACMRMSVLNEQGVTFDRVYEREVLAAAQAMRGSAREDCRLKEDEHIHDHEHTSLPQILKLIERSAIDPTAKELSERIFTRLANAEARVHNVQPDMVHFHEVGAVDAIVDVVGFAIGYSMLGIEKSFCSAVAIGSGKTQSEHGLYPAPGPATAYLLQAVGAATCPSQIEFECLTPTGAAILTEICSAFGSQPAFNRIESVGYGAGTKDPAGWPNACRVVIGESSASTTDGAGLRFDTETIAVLEANLDDMQPQAIAFVMEQLLEAGALDATVSPVVMKKGRPGHVLTVLCRPDHRLEMEAIIFKETTTLGVRFHETRRSVARRRWQSVRLPEGDTVRIKLAEDVSGIVVNAQPEYEDCAAGAAKRKIPLKQVMNEAMAAYLNQQG